MGGFVPLFQSQRSDIVQPDLRANRVKLGHFHKMPTPETGKYRVAHHSLRKVVLTLMAVGIAISTLFSMLATQTQSKMQDHQKRMQAALLAAGLRLVRVDDSALFLTQMNETDPVRLSAPVKQSISRTLARMREDEAKRYLLRARDDRNSLSEYRRFTPVHFNEMELHAREKKCLAQAIYYEARSESFLGQLAVAEVVANRVIDKRYPNSFCGVVFQGASRRTGCQFSFTCDGSLRKSVGGKAWDRAKELAAHVLIGFHEPVTRGATHYHTRQVNPYWALGLIKTRSIGSHIFYKFPGGMKPAQKIAQNSAANPLLHKLSAVPSRSSLVKMASYESSSKRRVMQGS